MHALRFPEQLEPDIDTSLRRAIDAMLGMAGATQGSRVLDVTAAALDVDEGGYFKPQPGSQVQTNIPGIYVAGDCSDHIYRQAITAAGMGCQAAIEAERWLAEHHG